MIQVTLATMVAMVAMAAAAVPDGEFERCQASEACRRLYHQFPPSRAAFNRLYNLGDTETEAVDLRARAAELRPCPHNEKYIVSATGEGVCTCSSEHTQTCGEVTPFHNTIIYAACVLSSVTIVVHVIHSVMRKKSS